MSNLLSFADKLVAAIHFPNYIKITDVIEILIIAFLVYHILVWIKDTRAWALLKGVFVIFIFIAIAAVFNMTTILWIAENVLSIAVIAFIVVMQPELRKALEKLGSKGIFSSILPFETTSGRIDGPYSEKTINEIVKACFSMGRVKTGALIVLENKDTLKEYETTGIAVDGIVTSALLINIFEKNTPLHDGAVIVRGNRVVSATAYLPLSESRSVSKELGTRHRAALGMSEANDSLTIVVSEETGHVSVAFEGRLYTDLSADGLFEKLSIFLPKEEESGKKHLGLKWRNKS
ncbi:MAG: diadenylate cyclase CdaA [Lachnospiraceae bacterium]|nr:diadenylate cyclase CdaA [Candidatus Merdinaster equi]